VTRRGRPYSDRLGLLERMLDELEAEPGLASYPGVLSGRVRAGRADVRRGLRILRRARDMDLPPPRVGRPENSAQKPGSGLSEGAA